MAVSFNSLGKTLPHSLGGIGSGFLYWQHLADHSPLGLRVSERLGCRAGTGWLQHLYHALLCAAFCRGRYPPQVQPPAVAIIGCHRSHGSAVCRIRRDSALWR